jgi:DNA mismatch endonuclease (patch repair protein)
MGLRFRLHRKNLPGRPDLVLKKWKTVIFVNGCFWHRHSRCPRTTTPQSNKGFWEKKFKENTERDKANYARLKILGWRVVIIWQCEISTSDKAITAIKRHFAHQNYPTGKSPKTCQALRTKIF